MTLILKFGLDMVKMYLHTKNEVSMSRGSKVKDRTDRNTDRQRQTDGQTDTHTQTHTDRHDRKHYPPAYADGKNNHFIPSIAYLPQKFLHVKFKISPK